MQEADSQQFNLFTKIIRWRKTKVTLVLANALLISVLLLDWSFVRYRLLDESMAPAFWGGQKVITLRWAYLLQSPQRGDLIIYKTSPGTFRPGKIAAVHGDELNLVDGTLYINTLPLPGVQPPSGFSKDQVVPDNYICVAELTPLETPNKLKLVPIHSICGKILGHWQVLII